MLSILVPTIELRDALITDIVSTIRGVSERPIVAVRLIGVVDDAEEPTLTMHIRSRTAITRERAEAVTSETLRRYAPRLDLSGVKVKVIGQPSPDEPSMR
jgi:phage baseplate assembly protein W